MSTKSLHPEGKKNQALVQVCSVQDSVNPLDTNPEWRPWTLRKGVLVPAIFLLDRAHCPTWVPALAQCSQWVNLFGF